MAMPSPTFYHRWLGWHAPDMRRVGTAAVVGSVVGVTVRVAMGWELALLCSWDATAVTFLAAVVPIFLRADGERTKRLAVREDVNRELARGLLLVASGISLGAVGLVLHSARNETGADRVALVTLAVFTIVASWTVVNTVFTLRYARLYYEANDGGGSGGGAGGGIDFGGNDTAGDPPPDYRDFAYLAFTIGMTYQVSDTNLRNRALRRSVLAHALVAYVFGVVIVSAVVNIVAGLLS
jgi:uncharacterized membrane protein